MKIFRNSRGDTIVEVLIAIAVLSFILSVTYTLANRSNLGVRQAQEKGETYKLTESAVENLKLYTSSANPSNQLPPEGAVFCVKSDGSSVDIFAGTPPPTEAQFDNFTAYASHPDCKKGNYYTFVKRGTGTESNNFTVYTRWYRVNGNGVDESSMVYKLFPDIAGQLGGVTNPGGNCTTSQGKNPNGICVPCPTGYQSPGGDVTLNDCTPIPPKIQVYARYIDPDPGNVAPSCTKAPGSTSKAVSVTIQPTSGGVPPVTASAGGASPALFSNLQFGTSYNASYSVPAGTWTEGVSNGQSKYVACGATTTSVATTNVPASTTTSDVFRFRPRCSTHDTVTWTYDPVASSWYSDIIRYDNAGWRRGPHLGTHDGYYATSSVGTTDTVFSSSWSSTGAVWFIWDDYSSVFPGYSWYEVWEAYWYSGDPVYGSPYYHTYQWNSHTTTSNICP